MNGGLNKLFASERQIAKETLIDASMTALYGDIERALLVTKRNLKKDYRNLC